MHICDGCGAPADQKHIRDRIERLELATRFRPIHIQVLLLGDAPAALAEDYFYRSQPGTVERSAGSRAFFQEMLVAAGMPGDAAANEEAALAEFQRRGFYLADVLECPVAMVVDWRKSIEAAAPTVIKRIEFSYKPKHVVAIGREVQGILPAMLKTGSANKFVMVGTGEQTSASSGAATSNAGSISGRQIAAALASLS